MDIKMFAEIRISWTLLFAIAMGAVSKQYELYGRVSGNAWLFAVGTGLYLNACAKVSLPSFNSLPAGRGRRKEADWCDCDFRVNNIFLKLGI